MGAAARTGDRQDDGDRHHHSHCETTQKNVDDHQKDDGDIKDHFQEYYESTQRKVMTKTATKTLKKRMAALLEEPENKRCSECWSKKYKPKFMAILLQAPIDNGRQHKKLGVFCCSNCQEFFQEGLGEELCAIKSLKTPEEWTQEDVETLEQSGNKTVNAMYCSGLGGNHTDEHMGALASAAFVESKYKDCLYFSQKAYHEQMELRAAILLAEQQEARPPPTPTTTDLVRQALQRQQSVVLAPKHNTRYAASQALRGMEESWERNRMEPSQQASPTNQHHNRQNRRESFRSQIQMKRQSVRRLQVDDGASPPKRGVARTCSGSSSSREDVAKLLQPSSRRGVARTQSGSGTRQTPLSSRRGVTRTHSEDATTLLLLRQATIRRGVVRTRSGNMSSSRRGSAPLKRNVTTADSRSSSRDAPTPKRGVARTHSASIPPSPPDHNKRRGRRSTAVPTRSSRSMETTILTRSRSRSTDAHFAPSSRQGGPKRNNAVPCSAS